MKHDDRHRIIGGRHRAAGRYAMIVHRLNHTNEKKNSCYEGIKLLIDREVFINWFMENDFEGASVDRIDPTKDYTLDNIQLIPLAENIRKDKVKAKNGVCECYKCKQVKPLEYFSKDSSRQNGHSTLCRSCDSKRRMDYEYRKRNLGRS